MLKTTLLQPQILKALASAGHGSQVLIADGNYPFSTTLGSNATLVHLNLSPGVVSCTQVLNALVSTIAIEEAAVMEPPPSGPFAQDGDPPVWDEFSKILSAAGGPTIELQRVERFRFYEAANSSRVALTIATGEQRIFANLLLTIGVVFP